VKIVLQQNCRGNFPSTWAGACGGEDAKDDDESKMREVAILNFRIALGAGRFGRK